MWNSVILLSSWSNAEVESVPIHRGWDPLQVPSSWHMRVVDPTRTLGAMQAKVTSDLKIKLRPSLCPLAGVPGSPQNFAAEAKMEKIPDKISDWSTGVFNLFCNWRPFYIVKNEQHHTLWEDFTILTTVCHHLCITACHHGCKFNVFRVIITHHTCWSFLCHHIKEQILHEDMWWLAWWYSNASVIQIPYTSLINYLPLLI